MTSVPGVSVTSVSSKHTTINIYEIPSTGTLPNKIVCDIQGY